MTTPDAQRRLGDAIEDLLSRATLDEDFRLRLLSERSGAAAAIGVKLHPAEKQLIDTYPEDRLATMIDNTLAQGSARRRFLKAASVAAVATVSAGLARDVSAGEKGEKKDEAARATAKSDSLLPQLKKIEVQLEAARKQLQKETANIVADVTRRKAEKEEVPRKIVAVAGILPPPTFRSRRKTKEEQERDRHELKRIEILAQLLEEIQNEVESARIEIRLKKKALEEE
jgi:hypothetical protein